MLTPVKQTSHNRWFRIGLFNLAVVALYGTVMRYKIVYDFSLLDQRHLLHAHSHFAFGGWIGHLLYSGLFFIISPFLSSRSRKVYNTLIAVNLICSFGMLIAFTIQGYKFISIGFSTCSIIITVIFAGRYFKDSRLFPAGHHSKQWALAGLMLNVLSSIGPFSLAYMLATGNTNSHFYLGSVYYYLHFQYNGWFFFGSVALLVDRLPVGFRSLQKYFYLLLSTAVVSFFLSVLWVKLPIVLYALTVLAALLQLLAWGMLAQLLRKHLKLTCKGQPAWVKVFLAGAALALSIKFILQMVSVIPSLNQLVFGIRPIIIAYLHLVLLGVYSLFLTGWLGLRQLIYLSRWGRIAAFVFFLAVLLNETLLAIQGFAAFAYFAVPYINDMLLLTAVLLFGSAMVMAVTQQPPRNSPAGTEVILSDTSS